MCAAALKGFKYRVALGDTAGDVTDEGDYSATVVAEQSKLVIRGLPALLIPADLHGYLDVLVCSVAEVDRVFVQLLNESDNLDWTTCMLQAVYNDPYADGVEVLLNPQRGQLCVVKSRSDGRWYRACVIERASPSDVTVYYLDYGKSDTVDKKTVRSITTLLSSRPPQAIAVSLANVSCTDAQLDLFNVRAFLENRQVTLHLEATTGVALVASMTYVDANGAHIIVNDVIMGRSHSNYAPVKANSLIQSRPFVNSSKAAIVGSDQSHNTLERPTRIGDVPTRKLIGSVHRVIDQEKQLPFDTSRATLLTEKSSSVSPHLDLPTIDINLSETTIAARPSAPVVDPAKVFDRKTLLWMRAYLPACAERPTILREEHFTMMSNKRMMWNPQSWWMSHFGEDDKQQPAPLYQKRCAFKQFRNNRQPIECELK